MSLDDRNSIIFIAKSAPGNFASLPPDFPFNTFPGTVIGKGIFVPGVERRTYIFPDTGEELPYWIYVSSKVTADVPAPFIVALHGMGVNGDFQVRAIMDYAEEGGYIVVGPQGYTNSAFYGSPWMGLAPGVSQYSENDVICVMDMMLEEFNIDPERVYLMGHSMGGAGTLFLGGKYAERWTALGAIAPAAFMMTTNRAAYMAPIRDANIPVMIVAGGQDTMAPPSVAEQFVATMEGFGMTYEYILQPDADHGSIIYSALPDIFRFFEENNKKP